MTADVCSGCVAGREVKTIGLLGERVCDECGRRIPWGCANRVETAEERIAVLEARVARLERER